MFAKSERTAKEASFHNLSTVTHVDRTSVGVDDSITENSIRLNEEGMGAVNTDVRGNGGGSSTRGKTLKVGEEAGMKTGKSLVGIDKTVNGKGVSDSMRVRRRKGNGTARRRGGIRGIKGGIEGKDGRGVSPESKEGVGLPEGLAGTEGENGSDEGGVGGKRGIDEEIVRGNGKGVFFTEIRAGKMGSREAQVMFPLLAEGEDAGTKLGNGTGKGKRTEGIPGIVVE